MSFSEPLSTLSNEVTSPAKSTSTKQKKKNKKTLHLEIPALLKESSEIQLNCTENGCNRLSMDSRALTETPVFWKVQHLESEGLDILHVSQPILNACSLKFQPELHSMQLKKKENHKLTFLTKNGYSDLAEKLERAKGYPANLISQIPHIPLMELLFQLQDELNSESKFLSEKESSAAMQIALSWAYDATKDISHISDAVDNPEIKVTLTKIGQLIYFLDKLEIKDCHLSNTTADELAEKLKLLFGSTIDLLKDNLKEIHESHQGINLHNPDVVLNALIPFSISNLLITKHGTVNTGLIPELMKIFILDPNKPINHEINIFYGLTQFLTDPLFRKKFNLIEKPGPTNKNSEAMIRVSLGLSLKEPIQKIHAQKVAMAALLSHLRQPTSGSCFADALAIELLASQLNQCLDDFICLIKNGKLIRHVDNHEIEFPFIFTAEKQKSIISINPSGEILPSKTPLWEVPGIISACRALGIEKVKTKIKKILKNVIFLNKDASSINLTVNRFLKLLADEAYISDEVSSVNALYSHATFAYDSQISNSLLKMWRNSIAGMAEAHKESMITSSIKTCTRYALDVNFKDISREESLWIDLLYQKFFKELSYRIQLKYDPNISHYEATHVRHKNTGAFVLYDKNFAEDSNDWIRIDSPQLYQKFIVRVIRSAKKQIKNLSSYKANKKKYKLIVSHLADYINSEAFILRILHNYHQSNFLVRDPLKNYKKLKYTPWITKTGNDSFKVLQVYMEKPEEIKQISHKPSSSLDLLKSIIDLKKSMPPHEKEAYRLNPYKLIPAKMKGIHSFSLMLGHPSFLETSDGKLSEDQWINEHIVKPGKTISSSIIEKPIQDALIQFCKGRFLKNATLEKFDAKCQAIASECTYKNFRNELIKILAIVDPVEESIWNERVRRIDTEICKNLPKDLLELLKKSAVHFADTNWNVGIYDIHLCFMINPGSGNLEIWQTYDEESPFLQIQQKCGFGVNSGSGELEFLKINPSHSPFTAIDQHYWLTNRHWEFCEQTDILE